MQLSGVIELETVEGITRAHMTSRRSRAVGYGVGAFLVRGLLVDTGFPGVRAEFARLLDALRPRGVILTHHHEDHAGNLDVVVRRGLPVWVADDTMAALRAGVAMGPYRRFTWGRLAPFAGDVRPLAVDGLEMLFTPGHAPDHHAVWDPATETLLAGDLFLGVKVRVARPGEDPRALVASLRRAAALRPRVMLDSHRGLIPEPVAALEAKARWLEDTIGEIDRRIAAGESDRAITRAVLGGEDLLHLASFGDLSRINLVRAVRASPERR